MRFLLIIPLVLLNYQLQEPEFFIKLKDGTLFSSTLGTKKLNVKTEYGDLKIGLDQIIVIKSGKNGFQIKTKKTNVLGKIVNELKLKSKYGSMSVALDDIAEIVPGKKKIFHDDNVVGYWEMDGSDEIKIHGGEIVTEDDASAIKLDLSKGDHIEIPHKAELNPEEAVTVEMRFKFKSLETSGNYINLVYKGERYHCGGQTGYFFLFWPGEKRLAPGSNTQAGQEVYINNTLDIQPEKWHHLVTAFDSKESKMKTWFDGKLLGNTTSVLDFGGSKLRTNELPIYICKENNGNKNIIWFDYVRISNKVRTDEEIKELAESGSLSGGIKPSSDKEYNALIATKDGERFSCKLDSGAISLESALGEVKVDAKAISKISFFQYRKLEIEKLHKTAKDLIPKLGSDDPVTRDTTQEELQKMGWIIAPVLEENKEHKDEEVKSRVLKLLEYFAGKKYEIKKDLIEGSGLSIKGWLKEDSIKATTKYGELHFKASDLKIAVLNNKASELKNSVTFQLNDGSIISGKLSNEKITLVTDFGKMEVDIKEILTMRFDKDEDVITTKKSVLKGKISQDEFELDGQIGKIKIKKSSIAGISSTSFKPAPEKKENEHTRMIDELIEEQETIIKFVKSDLETGQDSTRKLQRELSDKLWDFGNKLYHSFKGKGDWRKLLENAFEEMQNAINFIDGSSANPEKAINSQKKAIELLVKAKQTLQIE